MSNKITENCNGCTRSKTNGVCIAINNPGAVWQNGACWAYTADPKWYVKYVEAVKSYAKSKGCTYQQRKEVV